MPDMNLPALPPHVAWQLGKRCLTLSATECSTAGGHLLHSGQPHQAPKTNKNGRCNKAQAPDSSKKKDAGMYLSPCGPS